MKKVMQNWLSTRLASFHRDEQGADMVEYVLIIAAVALPILAVVLWFRKEIVEWIGEAWEDIKSGEGTSPDEM